MWDLSSLCFIWPAEDGSLHISSVQYSDAGEYYCIAENRAGRHQKRMILIITGVLIDHLMLFLLSGNITKIIGKALWTKMNKNEDVKCGSLRYFSQGNSQLSSGHLEWVLIWSSAITQCIAIQQNTSLTSYKQVYFSCWFSFMSSFVLCWRSTSWQRQTDKTGFVCCEYWGCGSLCCRLCVLFSNHFARPWFYFHKQFQFRSCKFSKCIFSHYYLVYGLIHFWLCQMCLLWK